MAETDLTDQYQDMCKQAEYSLAEIQDAIQLTRNQRQTDAAGTKKASETADDRPAAARNDVSGRWQQLRERVRAHHAKVREDVKMKMSEMEASQAAHYADEAESDAQKSIEHAVDAIGEAEQRVVYAVHARAEAHALASPTDYI